MSGIDGNGQYGGPGSQRSRLDNPNIKAVLEANRAKLSLMSHPPPGKDKALIGSMQPHQGPPAGGARPQAGPPVTGQLRSNPVYEEAQRQQRHNSGSLDDYPAAAPPHRPARSLLPAEPSLPPVGDLFATQPALPVGTKLAPGTPTLPEWNSTRAHLSGRALLDSAAAGSAGASSSSGRIHYDGASGGSSSNAGKPLAAYPPSVQESLLVDDLLSAFGGLDGEWIKAKIVKDSSSGSGPGGAPSSRHATTSSIRLRYEISPAAGQLEPNLREMAGRMLPMCEYVAVAARFVETRRRYEWGLVCQALAGAMRQVLQDWDLMLAQLEHQLRAGRLTLQALWYYVQPPMASLRLVATLAAEASAHRLRGASLLNLLHSKCGALMGDVAGQKLMLRLLRAAAEPYFAALGRWICEGVLDDPYEELMVRENAGVLPRDPISGVGDASCYWADRFLLRTLSDPLTGIPQMSETGAPVVDVPHFLAGVAREVLDAGRYLNLVRSCGRQPPRSLALGTHLEYDEGGKYQARIQEAHAAAAAAAMTLLRKEVGLVTGLTALKKYFLVAQGDLILHFMDLAEGDLSRLSGQVPLQILQARLEAAVRSCSAAEDASAAGLRAAFDHRSVLNMLITITQTASTGPTDSPSKKQKLRPVLPLPMTPADRATVGRQKLARESFMLCWEAPWPLSIVANDAALAQYQMVFRHLFELKWVERELTRVYGLYQATTALANGQRRATRRQSLVGAAAAAATPAGETSKLTSSLARAYRACQLMTHFFRQYLLYTTFEVLEPLWAAFEAKAEGAATLDEIVAHHLAFLHKVKKGLLLSRKVVVLRSLLGLKDLALQFARLSSRFLEIDYDAVDEAAEIAVLGRQGLILDGERRAARDLRLRAMLEQQLMAPEFIAGVTDLHGKFEARTGEFMTALAEAHAQARSERSDTREELEGLVNLMGRLDFNGYLAGRGVHSVPLGDV